MKTQITLPQLLSTQPLSKLEHKKIDRMMITQLKKDAGSSEAFRFKVGDEVENFTMYKEGFAKPEGTVIEVYRENGHNRVATETGFHREQDLRKV